MVAETAALLLTDNRAHPEWAALLARHRFEVGYFSIMPDSDFRNSDGQAGKLEGPTHFFDFDLALGTEAITPENRTALAVKLKAIPREATRIKPWLEKQLGADLAATVGSAPWRVAQLAQMAKTELDGTSRPQGGYERGSTAEGDAKRIYRAMVYLGILSHYTGDSSMPYHGSSDWNGYKTGHGGIHFFFETDCVNAMEPGLSGDVLKVARRRRADWVRAWSQAAPTSIPEVMLQVLFDSFATIPKLEKLDDRIVLLKPAKGEKKDAVRKPTEKACPAFRNLIVDRLARAAVLTAWVWEQTLPLGKDLTQLSKLQFSDFDWRPAYIPPDY